MSRAMFRLDPGEIKRLAKLYRRMPGQFNKASAGTLNSFGFGSRVEALKIIERRMIVRSPRFVKSAIRVQKARGNQHISQQVAFMGSIPKARFSGWKEQELGTPSKRTRVPMIASRGDNKQKKVKPSLRMRAGRQFKSPDDFPGRSSENRVISMLRILERRRERTPFIIHGHHKFESGLYHFKGRKLRMLQSFNPRNRQPQRIRWMTGGRRNFFKGADIRAIWTKNLNHVLKRGKKR